MSEHTLPADHETDLTGQWVSKRRKVVGDATTNRIEWLIGNHLVLLGRDASGMSELYRDPASGKLWELTWPQPEMHGGGPPRLTQIEVASARAKYGSLADG